MLANVEQRPEEFSRVGFCDSNGARGPMISGDTSMYVKCTKAHKPDRNLTRLGAVQTPLGTFGTPVTPRLEARGQKTRSLPLKTEVHCRRVLVGGGLAPPTKTHLHLGTRSYISNTIWYISNATWYI